MRGLTADASPGQQILAKFSQSRHAVVDGNHASAGEQSDGKLCHVLRRGKCAVGCVDHPLHDLSGISRPVEQQCRGDERRALETMATTGTETASEARAAGPTMTAAMFVPAATTKTAPAASKTAWAT